MKGSRSVGERPAMAGPHSPGKRGQTDPGEEKEASESTKSSVEGKPSGARG